MRIVYWSDFNCPYSYIGLVRIKNAAEELNLDVDWDMKAFELEPDADISTLVTIKRFAIDNRLPLKESESEILEVEEIARSDGLEINYRDLEITSSRDAHRLVKYYQNKNPQKAQELAEKIFEANFVK